MPRNKRPADQKDISSFFNNAPKRPCSRESPGKSSQNSSINSDEGNIAFLKTPDQKKPVFVTPNRKINNYQDYFIEYGFWKQKLHLHLTDKEDHEYLPVCLVPNCNYVGKNSVMKKAFLKKHFNDHIESNDQNLDKFCKAYFEQLSKNFKADLKTDQNASKKLFVSQKEKNKSYNEVSLWLSYYAAKDKKSHSICENLVKPSMEKTADILWGPEYKKEIQKISLSDDTVQRRISWIASDIKDQVIQEIKSAAFGMFALQTDESGEFIC